MLVNECETFIYKHALCFTIFFLFWVFSLYNSPNTKYFKNKGKFIKSSDILLLYSFESCLLYILVNEREED